MDDIKVAITNHNIDQYLNDKAYYVFRLHGNYIIQHRNKLDSLKLDTKSLGILKLCIHDKVPVIELSETKQGLTIQLKKIGDGTYGNVFLSNKKVLKEFKYMDSWIIELATYELINTAYPNPEEYNLPRILGSNRMCIYLPNYGTPLTVHHDISKWSTQIMCSVYHLHALGLIHRDIKHSNVIIDKQAVLVDFGLTCWFPTLSRSKVTSIQTMYYRAPEVAVNPYGKYDHFIDEWSIGIMLASNGSYLFTPTNRTQLLRELDKLFGVNVLTLKENKSPVKKLRGDMFLQFLPQCRQTVGEYLDYPKLTKNETFKLLPISKAMGKMSISTNLEILKGTHSWTAYFTAIDYYLLHNDVKCAILLANILHDRQIQHSFHEDLYKYIKLITCKLYRLNTYLILLHFYPHSIRKLVEHCFIMSLEGYTESHQNQAKWMAYYMLGIGKYESETVYNVYHDKVKMYQKLDCGKLMDKMK
jgi:serine/threonine protein kinase